VPAFVPPSHVLLFIVGAWVANKPGIPPQALCFLSPALTRSLRPLGGGGNLIVFICCMSIAFWFGTRHKPYTATLLLSLALELLRTATGTRHAGE
jgi:hypothetical protein